MCIRDRTYASDTWTLPKSDERQLNIFERRIVRQIFGPLEEGGAWRKSYNLELYHLYDEPDVITSIKLKRLEWAGHICACESRVIKKIFNAKPDGKRKVGS